MIGECGALFFRIIYHQCWPTFTVTGATECTQKKGKKKYQCRLRRHSASEWSNCNRWNFCCGPEQSKAFRSWRSEEHLVSRLRRVTYLFFYKGSFHICGDDKCAGSFQQGGSTSTWALHPQTFPPFAAITRDLLQINTTFPFVFSNWSTLRMFLYWAEKWYKINVNCALSLAAY